MKLWNRIVSFVSWHRRAIAALCAAVCVAGVVAAAQAPPPPGEPVVAARETLPAGHMLTADDLVTVDVPAYLVTDASIRSPDDAVGATTGVAAEAGQPLSSHALIRAGTVDEGRALVPIHVADDELRALLQAGTTVTLIVALGEAPEVVTNDARVATLGAAEPSGTLAGARANGGMIVVDVPDKVAGVVAVLGQSGQLAVILGRL